MTGVAASLSARCEHQHVTLTSSRRDPESSFPNLLLSITAPRFEKRQKMPASFVAALEEATAVVGADNIIEPAAAKALLEAHPDALFLDVQDSEGRVVTPGTYQAT